MAWTSNDPSRTVPLSVTGVTFPGGCDQALRRLFTLLLTQTEKMGYQLHKGWCWGYYNKDIAGSTTLSYHGRGGGRAIDINAPTNGRGTRGDIPLKVVQMWESFGFTWGGRWSYTDPMHLEFHGSPKSAKRQEKRAEARFGDVKLVYKVGPRVFGKVKRAISFLRGKVNRGDAGDDFHLRVAKKPSRRRG